MGGLELVKVEVPVAPRRNLVAVAAKIRNPGMSHTAERINLVMTMRAAVFEEMEDTLFDALVSAIESIPRARRKDLDMVQEAARRAVRSAANHAWGKKPVVTVFLSKV